MSKTPHLTIVLAMSADGKIADYDRSPARFGSQHDRAHLETRIAAADAVLFGAATLRAYGTSLRITRPDLLHQRQAQGQPDQPIHIVCSRSAEFNPEYPFFRQPIRRWLLTSQATALNQDIALFERVLVSGPIATGIDWSLALAELQAIGLERLVVMGGGELAANLLQAGYIDELWLTVCPLILGGRDAPSPVAGVGFLEKSSPRLQLLSAQTIADEVFLHYAIRR